MPKRSSQPKKRREMAIPTDSFSDIAFLLIVYFLVATTLVKVKSITADLPAGEKSSSAQSDKTPTVNLRGNEIFLNDKPLDLPELNARLAALELPALAPEKRVVLLESAAGTPYQNYFQALAAISANGGVVAIVEEEKKQ
jgi:biopolymer transport protein ExbD